MAGHDLRRARRPAPARPRATGSSSARSEGERRAARGRPDVPLAGAGLGVAAAVAVVLSGALDDGAAGSGRRAPGPGRPRGRAGPARRARARMPASTLDGVGEAARRASGCSGPPAGHPGRGRHPDRRTIGTSALLRAPPPASRARNAAARSGSPREASSSATAAASATPTPRRRWSRRRAAPSRRRCGPRWRCSRSAASCCGGCARPHAHSRGPSSVPAGRDGGRRARGGHPARPARRRCELAETVRRPDERRPTTRPSRRCWSSSSAPRRSTSRATSAPSLQRRFRRRMETVGCESFGDYLDYLEVHPEEYEQLFEMLLINVTEFFRDPPAWEHLRDDGRCPSCSPRRTGRARARLERGLRGRPGGLHGRDGARRAARRRRLSRAREDLRDRHRRRRARQARLAIYTRQGDRIGPGGAARALLRARRPAARVPQGPAPDGDLRPQQPGPGRADLAPGPAGLPQHADVLQRRDPGAGSCGTSISRCATAAC